MLHYYSTHLHSWALTPRMPAADTAAGVQQHGGQGHRVGNMYAHKLHCLGYLLKQYTVRVDANFLSVKTPNILQMTTSHVCAT